ncbi:hypothetical protein BDW74DRAFT_153271 [Aspergillus multicolor]|uniref:uncharacterized protein n=1 Tax=Aspergillus multicolor TaxID=41759 RepID=UPI003CCD5BBE
MRAVARRQDLAAFVKRIYNHLYLLESFDATQELWARHYANPSEHPRRQRTADRPHPRLCIAEHEAQDALQEVACTLELESIKQLSARDLVTLLLAELPNPEHCSLHLGPYYLMKEVVSPAGLSKAGILHLPLKTLDISLRPLHDNLETTCCTWLFRFEQSVGALLSVYASGNTHYPYV